MLKENNSTKPAQRFGRSQSNHFLQIVAWALVFVAALPHEVKAYTDPGTGTFLLQMLLAAITGGLFFMRTLRHRIKMLFKRNRDSGATEDSASSDNQLND